MGCTPTISFDIPSVQLPFGIELQAIADFSKGPPNQCAMLSNLLVQLTPAMAAMSPIITIINVFAALKGFLKLPPGDPTAAVAAIEALVKLIDPAPFITAVKSILLLVIEYLNCFITTMEGLLAFQASIDLSAAVGNPALQASLQCASENAATSIQQLLQSLGPIGPILNLVQPFMSIAGLSIPLPSLSSMQGAQDMEQMLKTLSKTLTDLQQVVEAIPT